MMKNDNLINSFVVDMKIDIYIDFFFILKDIFNLYEFGEGGEIKIFFIQCYCFFGSLWEVV